MEQDSIGMSPAKVVKITRKNELFYLKYISKIFSNTTFSVKREAELMAFLKSKIAVPDLVMYEENDQYECMIVQSVEGELLYEISSPQLYVELLAEAFTMLKTIDPRECTFQSDIDFRLHELKYLIESNLIAIEDFNEEGLDFATPQDLVNFLENTKPSEEIVFSHGDLGDSNIIVVNRKIKGIIDWGRGGKADKWVDISFGVSNILDKYDNQEYVERYFKLIDEDPSFEKIKYHQLVDVLF